MNAETFNALYEVGIPVFAYPGARPEDHPTATRLVTRTRSRAMVLNGRTDVVWVDGHSSCIALSHVDVVTEDEYSAAVVAEQGALPVPAGSVPQPLSGGYPPVFPWAALMDDEDLTEFLGDLIDSLNSNPASTRQVLDEVEKTCATWRLIAEAQHGHNTAPGPDGITRAIAPTQALRKSFEEKAPRETDSVRRSAWRMLARDRSLEDPHDSPLHHPYTTSRDLPETGGPR